MSYFSEMRDILDKLEVRQTQCIEARQLIRPAILALEKLTDRLPKSSPNWISDEIGRIAEMLEESITPRATDGETR